MTIGDLEEAIADWRAHLVQTESKVAGYTYKYVEEIRLHLAVIERMGVSVDNLTAEHVQKAIDARARIAGPASHVGTAPRSFYAFLHGKGLIGSNPARDTVGPIRLRNPALTYSVTNMSDLLDFAEERALRASEPFHEIRQWLVAELVYATGIRAGELMYLPTDAITGNFLTILRSAGRRRRVPLNKATLRAASLWTSETRKADLAPSEWLFFRPNGQQLWRDAAASDLTDLTGAFGENWARNATLGTIRSTFARHLLEGGCPIEVVGYFMDITDVKRLRRLVE